MRYEINSLGDHMAMLERMAGIREFKPYTIELKLSDGRTAAQNDLMWPSLREISKQVEWDGQYLPPETWKELFTAHLRGQRPVRGLEGGVVFVGAKTSQLSKQEMTDLMHLIFSWGADHNVEFTETGETNATI